MRTVQASTLVHTKCTSVRRSHTSSHAHPLHNSELAPRRRQVSVQRREHTSSTCTAWLQMTLDTIQQRGFRVRGRRAARDVGKKQRESMQRPVIWRLLNCNILYSGDVAETKCCMSSARSATRASEQLGSRSSGIRAERRTDVDLVLQDQWGRGGAGRGRRRAELQPRFSELFLDRTQAMA